MSVAGDVRSDGGGQERGLNVTQPAKDRVLLELSGAWTLAQGLPSDEQVKSLLKSQTRIRRLEFDTKDLEAWDSSLLTFLMRLNQDCAENQVEVDGAGLPEGARRLMKLATAVPERAGARRQEERETILEVIGKESLALFKGGGEMVSFIGQSTQSFGRFLIGRAQFRRSDMFLVIQESGANALPIVTLIALLVGLILAFVGAIQLQQFGAQIYVANLVGIAMTREMGAIMTAIIMAGRTGAAFAAQIGTMQVNEEVDALSTLGLQPMDFLVLPRMLALIMMMPLLCVYADLMGIVGGGIVGVGLLDISLAEYANQTQKAVSLTDCAIGIVKSAVFGILIAVAGCMRGIQCGRSASAVGLATTSAVVISIVAIIVTDGIFAVLTNVLGI